MADEDGPFGDAPWRGRDDGTVDAAAGGGDPPPPPPLPTAAWDPPPGRDDYDDDYLADIAEYYDEVLGSLRNASADIVNCSLTNVWHWNVSGLVYMGDLLKVAVYAFISLSGLLGNALVVLLVLRNRPLRTTVNYYLLNLAVADIIISLFCVWIHLVDSVSRAPWVLGPFVCKISGFLQMTALTSSTMTLTVISADRVLAVKFPLKVRAMQRNCRKVIGCVWLLAIVVSVPFLVFREMKTLKWKTFEENICVDNWPQLVRFNARGDCYFDHFWKRLYYTSVSAALFFFPCCVMGINYSFIGAQIWRAEIPGDAESTGPAPPGNAVRRGTKYKVLKMVVIVMVVYCVCWTPLQFINLYAMWAHNAQTDGSLNGWFDVATFVSYTLAYANSALNPILYGGLNSAFRTAAMQVFSWLGEASGICCKERGRTYVPNNGHPNGGDLVPQAAAAGDDVDGNRQPRRTQPTSERRVIRVRFRQRPPANNNPHLHVRFRDPLAVDAAATATAATGALTNAADAAGSQQRKQQYGDHRFDGREGAAAAVVAAANNDECPSDSFMAMRWRRARDAAVGRATSNLGRRQRFRMMMTGGGQVK